MQKANVSVLCCVFMIFSAVLVRKIRYTGICVSICPSVAEKIFKKVQKLHMDTKVKKGPDTKVT